MSSHCSRCCVTPHNGPTYGEGAAKFFEGFFPSVVAISTLGASITFTVIISSLPEPKQTFAEESVRIFLAIAWLLFILGLALGTFLGSVMIFHRDGVRKGFELDSQSTRIRWWGIMAILVLLMIIIGSFLFLSLVVAAYVKVVGWIAVGCTSAFALVSVGAVVSQSPWFRTGDLVGSAS
jgi:hypothetical protein